MSSHQFEQAPTPIYSQLGMSEAEYLALLVERDQRQLDALKSIMKTRGYTVNDDGHGRFHVCRGNFDQVARGYDELRAIAVQRGVIFS
ncbi:hypothetical protein [Hydrogenophaga sp. NFH-34]|uniref:hypothetical protein n=1 Tax=Hydrogenophaga sp. NFH-34 TaxID=2744446 RepID=UPI001F2EA9A5|nr:hypothetical protein [Hydrogenophaga sp. NFH-34]